MSLSYLDVRRVTLRLGGRSILEDFDFQLEAGEVVSLIGPSGCGKSTLFNIISGLVVPDSGELCLQGFPLAGSRQHAAYMFQDHALLPWRTILNNVLLAAEVDKNYREPAVRRQRQAQAREYLATFGLLDVCDFYPQHLSGGMKQRAALARTFMADRSLYLFDEPFTGLDYFRKLQLEKVTVDFIHKERKTCLLVTHDLETALAVSHRLLLLGGPPCRVHKEIAGLARIADPVRRRLLPEFDSALREARETLAFIFETHAARR